MQMEMTMKMMQSTTINNLRHRAEDQKRLEIDTILERKIENYNEGVPIVRWMIIAPRNYKALDDNSSSQLQSQKCNRSISVESLNEKSQQHQSTPFGSQQRKNANDNRKCPSNLTKEL